MRPVRVPVLGYHAVLPIERDVQIRGTVPLAVFREQIRWLADHGFAAIGLDHAADLLEGRVSAPRKPVAITFDDGYRCVLEHALPVLEEAGFTATLFAVTAVVGKETDWYVPKGGRPFEHAGWDELERAALRGFEIGSHSVNHQRLTTLDPSRMAEELQRSRAEIRARLGSCNHFAYPFGAVPEGAEQALRRAGYRTASTTRRGLNRRGRSLLALRRQMISRTTGPGRFRRRLGAWW